MQNSNQSCSHFGRNLEQCILCQIVSCRFGPMSENGVLLQLQGRWPSGDRATVALKAYSPQPGMPLRWELRRVKPAAGYPETMPTHKLVKKQKDSWFSWMRACGWDPLHHFGYSHTAMSRKRVDVLPADVDQEYWLSTAGLIGILSWWAVWRRNRSDRERAKALAGWVMEHMIDTSFGISFHDIPAVLFGQCNQEPVLDERCHCVQEYLSRDRPGQQPVHTVCIDALEYLFKRVHTCGALGNFVGAKLKELGAHCEDTIDAWAVYDWQKLGAARLDGIAKNGGWIRIFASGCASVLSRTALRKHQARQRTCLIARSLCSP